MSTGVVEHPANINIASRKKAFMFSPKGEVSVGLYAGNPLPPYVTTAVHLEQTIILKYWLVVIDREMVGFGYISTTLFNCMPVMWSWNYKLTPY